jgi:signal transduction histidine kinase
VSEQLLPLLRRPKRPPLALGIAVGVLSVAAETLLAAALVQVTPARSVSEVYIPAILAISLVWGLWLGVATAVASGAVFAFLYLNPVMPLGVASPREWLELGIFTVVALMVCFLAVMVRALLAEIEERHHEADLAARMARLILGARDLRPALSDASCLLSEALCIPGLTIGLGAVAAPEGRAAVPIEEGASRLGTLLVPSNAVAKLRHRIRRLMPSLAALLRAVTDRAEISSELDRSHDELRRVIEEQAALRRVATLVARGVSPAELFSAVVGEMGRILRVETTGIVRYDPDRSMVYVGSWSSRGDKYRMPVGSRWPIEEPSVGALVWQTGRPARMTGYAALRGGIARWASERGIACGVGCPIAVEGRLWGVMIAVSANLEVLPEGVERRMAEFTELLGTAIGNAQAHAQLAESRARLVTTADETRRRIERDLHDGTQQRLVTLGLELRMAEAVVPPGNVELKAQLARAGRLVVSVVKEVQEVSRGLHPAILSEGGIRAALKMLARRSAVPVELDVRGPHRLAEQVEVTVYYVVSEALTNIAKYAQASVAYVTLCAEEKVVRLSIRDDGVGGADPRGGSGLTGLIDRVEALGGTMEIISPVGGGTSLRVTVPPAPRAPCAPIVAEDPADGPG